VIHFAGYSLVGESIKDPSKYYNNNIFSTFQLLETMRKFKVDKLVFSSTAAVYGNPLHFPIQESSELTPTNPYGEVKLSIERMLKWYNEAYSINFVALRYFNACGADKSGDLGEDHRPESHLIPIILSSILNKNRIQIFGNDYDTKDGTCVRDYVHVLDLVVAHVLALEKLRTGTNFGIYNLGSETGFSVKEIVNCAEKVTGARVDAVVTSRRSGDPAILIAKREKAKNELGWTPKHSSIEEIIEDAWRWHSSHPHGYAN
jgi:UDP-glucose 4-epimerase